jgi:plastocyanin
MSNSNRKYWVLGIGAVVIILIASFFAYYSFNVPSSSPSASPISTTSAPTLTSQTVAPTSLTTSTPTSTPSSTPIPTQVSTTNLVLYAIDGSDSIVTVQENSVLFGSGTVAFAGSSLRGIKGFSNTESLSVVPGPTLSFKIGDVVNMTVYNKGSLAYGWVIVEGVSFTESKLLDTSNTHEVFDSAIESINPGQSASVIFTVSQEGNFYYISPLQDGAKAGMWGKVTVTS